MTARKALKRRKRLAQVSAKRLRDGTLVPGSTFETGRPALKATPLKPGRRKPALPAQPRERLTVRSGGDCEIQLSVCVGQATDPSHRITTKSGGRHGEAEVRHARLSNVLDACRPCHEWLHDHPAAAKAEGNGWALEEWQEPTEWPVLYRGQLRWLTDDGNVINFMEGAL